MGSFTIGQLAQKAHIHLETVRYYEQQGLMPIPHKNASGYCQYSGQDLTRLVFIQRAKELGFSLKEILELLSLKVSSETTCLEVKRRAEAKIEEINTKMKTLRTMKQALMTLTKACHGRGPIGECPILEALESSSEGGDHL